MSSWPIVVAIVAVLVYASSGRMPKGIARIVLPLATAALFLAAWRVLSYLVEYELWNQDGSVRRIRVLPTPYDAFIGTERMFRDGVIFKYTVASLYRVAVGFGLACLVGIPLGLWTGWSTRASMALNPLVQALRPISPIAWIPIAILLFGVKDASAIFLVFLSSVFTITTGTMAAVRSIPVVYVRSAQNFGLAGFQLYRRVLFPASLPQIVTSMRLSLGVAWLVIVAAEMIAVDSGLGYMINDARNANYYDRVIGAMICIGIVGFALDWCVRRLEYLDEVRWGFSKLS